MIIEDDIVNLSDIKNNLVSEIEKLIKVIRNEYPNLVDLPVNYDLDKLVHIEETGTISLFVKNKNFYFPLDAFKVLGTLKKIPGFGMVKNHKTCSRDNMIINDNTFISYIRHVFLKGLTPEEYFKEILLHETLHFCGSGGGSAIREGINELKTRQLAQKYGLLTSSCGYPKETKIAYELEKIFGENIINRISFSGSQEEIKEILDSVSPDAFSFFSNLEDVMEREFYTKYMKYKFPGLMGPFKKTKKYNSIDYTKAYDLLEHYKKNMKVSKSINGKDLSIDGMLSKKTEFEKHDLFDAKKSLIDKKNMSFQNMEHNNEEKTLSDFHSTKTIHGVQKKPFDQRSQTEIQIAQQIRVKNQAIAQQKHQQKSLKLSKTLTKTNSNGSSANKGYANVIILFLALGFAVSMLTILMYFIFK